MTTKYLDSNGLSYFWGKIKALIPTKTSDITNDSGFITNPNIPYCTCATAAGTKAKTTTIVSGTFTADDLVTGAQVLVKFTNANSVADPTLKIGSTTAKTIKRYGTTAPSTSAATSWNAGAVMMFTYDGTYWQMVDWVNTTYTSMTVAEIEAGTGTTARSITPARLKTAVQTWDAVTSVNGQTGAVTVSDLSISSDGDLDGETYTITDGNTTYPFPSSNRFNVLKTALLGYIQSLAVNGNLFPTTATGNMYNLVLDGDDIAYDANTSVNAKIDTIISSGGEPNAINTISVNNVNQTITNKNVNIETVIIGSTSDYTPTQVKSAIDAGKNVIITYTHSTYGNIVGYSFNYSQAYNALVSNTIAYYNNNYYLFELAGTLTNNNWSCEVTQIAQSSDIPTVPTNISAFTNDSGYLTSYTETDPTVPSWAKQPTKPTYTASEVGALPSTTPIQTTGNLVTSVSSASTDTEYPSAKCLYEYTKTICQGTGTDASLSLTNGTITQVPLKSFTYTDQLHISGNASGTDYGIDVLTHGLYKISGSIYYGNASLTGIGCYVKVGTNGASYANATEIMGALQTASSTQAFSANFPPKVVELQANDRLYFAARAMGANGSIRPNNAATYFTVEFIKAL